MSIKKLAIVTLLAVFIFCVALSGCRPSPALTRMVEEDASSDITIDDTEKTDTRETLETAENSETTVFMDSPGSEKTTNTQESAENSTNAEISTQPSNSEKIKEADNAGILGASDTKQVRARPAMV